MCVGRSGFEVDDFANVDRDVARHSGTGFFFAKERTLAGGDCFYSGSAVASSTVGVHVTDDDEEQSGGRRNEREVRLCESVKSELLDE